MKLFGINKIMGHGRSSDQKRIDAGPPPERASQSESQSGKSQDDDRSTETIPQHLDPLKNAGLRLMGTCPENRNQNAENMYLLKNCDRCHDFTVGPCKKCPCSRRPRCSGQCSASDKRNVSQESLPPRDSFTVEPIEPIEPPPPPPFRRVGGTCSLCKVCGQQEVSQLGQCMCLDCNTKIKEAVEAVYIECQGQCGKVGGQPPPPRNGCACANPNTNGNGNENNVQWPQSTVPYVGQFGGEQNGNPYNIIVVQDCDNHAFLDQIASAINRGGAQIGGNMGNGPSNWNQQPCGGYGGYQDYEYGGYDQPQCYDNGYQMDDPYPSNCNDRFQGQRSPRGCENENCPLSRMRSAGRQSPGAGQQPTVCTCNCEACRKGFESKEKLAMLIAQALEIFIMGHQAKGKSDGKKGDNKGKGKGKKKGKKGKKDLGDSPSQTGKKGGMRSNSKAGKTEVDADSPASSNQNLPPRKNSSNIANPSKETNPLNAEMFDATSKASQQSQATSKTTYSLPKEDSFFLPNCAEHRCKYNCGGLCSRPPHRCGGLSCKGHCLAACSNSKSGGGDGRSRSSGRGGKGRSSGGPQQKHSRCKQCNNPGEGRHWEEVDSCPRGTWSATGPGKGCCSGGQERSSAGTAAGHRVKPQTLMGLSPIAHYRPGMLQFPVNYLLAGTQFRRRLARTAAGVTLHQRPYVNPSDVQDLPSFPVKPRESTVDCRPAPKRWL